MSIPQATPRRAAGARNCCDSRRRNTNRCACHRHRLCQRIMTCDAQKSSNQLITFTQAQISSKQYCLSHFFTRKNKKLLHTWPIFKNPKVSTDSSRLCTQNKNPTLVLRLHFLVLIKCESFDAENRGLDIFLFKDKRLQECNGPICNHRENQNNKFSGFFSTSSCLMSSRSL